MAGKVEAVSPEWDHDSTKQKKESRVEVRFRGNTRQD